MQFHGLKGNRNFCARLGADIIYSPLQTLTLRPKPPVLKLIFHNSYSRPSQASNNKGSCLPSWQLFKVSSRAASRDSRPQATADTNILTISLVRRLRPFGSRATGAFHHQRVSAIMVDSGSRQDLQVCGWRGLGAHFTSRSKTIFWITKGVWNALN